MNQLKTQIMKKLVFLSLLVMAGGLTSVNAQGKFKAGVKGGVNLASIGGDAYYSGLSYDSRVGFHIGGFLEIPFGEKISFQPEILYSAQGSGSVGSIFNLDFDDTKLNYVNVPLLGKYYIFKGLSAEAGPVVGVLISANGSDVFDSDGANFDIKEGYNTFDIGVAVGATYNFDFGFFAGLRYQKGISNINDDRFTNAKSQNNVFQITAGYSFL